MVSITMSTIVLQIVTSLATSSHAVSLAALDELVWFPSFLVPFVQAFVASLLCVLVYAALAPISWLPSVQIVPPSLASFVVLAGLLFCANKFT